MLNNSEWGLVRYFFFVLLDWILFVVSVCIFFTFFDPPWDDLPDLLRYRPPKMANFFMGFLIFETDDGETSRRTYLPEIFDRFWFLEFDFTELSR